MGPRSQRTNPFDDSQGGMVQLGLEGQAPQFCCTRLPRHWRSNKSLAAQFRVIAYDQIPDNTRCSLLAGNDENHSAPLKNNIAFFHNNVAEFSDLRFVGKSGRGKYFNVTVTVWTDPIQVLVYRHAIKVTADGPRPPRPKSGFSHGNDQGNMSSDSSTETDFHQDHHSRLSGVEKKHQKPKPSSHHDLSHVGLMEHAKSLIDLNRPSSCHSNSSTITTTTNSTHSFISSLGTSPTATPLQYLAAVVAASQLMQSTLCQTSQPLAVPTETSSLTNSVTAASFGHKPWLKQHEKQIWRPFVEDSH